MKGIVIIDDYKFAEAERLCIAATEDPRLLPEYEKAHARASALENNGWKRRTGMTQIDKLLKHFSKAGDISNREAVMDYSMGSLTKRISEMRELGYNITDEIKRHPVTGVEYKRYYMDTIEAARAYAERRGVACVG